MLKVPVNKKKHQYFNKMQLWIVRLRIIKKRQTYYDASNRTTGQSNYLNLRSVSEYLTKSKPLSIYFQMKFYYFFKKFIIMYKLMFRSGTEL